MDEYTLFLDETYTYECKGVNPAFAIGGFIVKNSNIDNINNKIDNLKKNIWSDMLVPTSVILHEMDLKAAVNKRVAERKLKSEYIRFRNNKNLAKNYIQK